jgi:cytochrome P450
MALPPADITSSDFKAGAYGYYAKLRAEAPVHGLRLPSGQTAWLVSRYDDVAPLLKDARLAKDRHNAAGSRPFSRLPGMLGFMQALEPPARGRADRDGVPVGCGWPRDDGNLIGNGALALLQFPEQLERLRADSRVDGTAVEELLRFHSPIEVSTERYAREPIEIAGVTIPSGALVYGLISSANRDETQFDDPDRLDLGRERNRHLAFGQGIHYCLGAPLARLEGQIALRRLLERMPLSTVIIGITALGLSLLIRSLQS